ncbi:hypothetical protein MRB53_040143 [Persea americana]|nr:hypothetical protein MRB53_040143 [Persea americana]
MCIALLSTRHPLYALILINNRDEYVNRPTAPLSWWSSSSHAHVLSGRDLLRSTQGTWLGVTRTGRIAVLTNYREDVTPPPTAVSRGEIIKQFLTLDEDVRTQEWVGSVVETGVARDAGGFTLLAGRVRTSMGGGAGGNGRGDLNGSRGRDENDEVVRGVNGDGRDGANGKGVKDGKGGKDVIEDRDTDTGAGEGRGRGLAVVSNRAGGGDVPWICGGDGQDEGMTVGVSNTAFEMSGKHRWPKIVRGEELLDQVIEESLEHDVDVNGSSNVKNKDEREDEFVEKLFRVLSDDELTRAKIEEAKQGGERWKPEDGLQMHVFELRNTIFVPPLGRKDVSSLELKDDELAAARKDEVAEILVDGKKVEEAKGQIDQRKLGVSGIYATQKQSVVLVGKDGRVRFVERTLFDGDSEPCDVRVEERFQIEGWDGDEIEKGTL